MAECQRCPFNAIVKAIGEINKTYTVPVPPSSTKEVNPLEYLIHISKKKKLSEAAYNTIPSLILLQNFLDEKILPQFQKICHTCSKVSNDDNPSHQGQVFVSIDAMSAKAPTVDNTDPREMGDYGDTLQSDIDMRISREGEIDDPNGEQFQNDIATQRVDAASEWMDENRNDGRATSYRNNAQANTSEGGVSQLPVHIEDMLKEQFANFVSLPMIDKLLVLHQMCNDSLVAFGTMKWLPTEVRKPMSKQVVCQHWSQICRKFPIAEALRRAKPGKGFATRLARNYTQDTMEQCELELQYTTSAK